MFIRFMLIWLTTILLITACAGDPQSAAALEAFEKGNTNLERSWVIPAITEYDKAIALDPDFIDAYNNRGWAYGSKGEMDQAIADFDRAIELNPDDAEAYNNKGLSKLNLGQKDSGCLDLSKAGEMGYMQAYGSIKQYCQ